MRRTLRGLLLTALLLSCGCAAPYRQAPLTPAAAFAGPVMEAAHDGTGVFVVQDGARLPYLGWTPREEPWAVIVALHGMNDHRASFRLAGPWWAERGIAVYAYDQRGFGRSPGRGEWAGELMIEDLRTVVGLVRARHPDAMVAVAGESMGGAVAIAAFASERPPDADRVVLLAPAVWGWSSQNLLNRTSLWIAARALGDRSVEPPAWAVRDIRPTDNTLELIRAGRDPDFVHSTRFDALYGLVSLMERASGELGRMRAPTLLLYGAHDKVIPQGPMRRALERAEAARRDVQAAGQQDGQEDGQEDDKAGWRTAYYPDGRHILNRDLRAEAVYRDVEAWLRDADAPLPSGAGPVLPALERRR